MDDLTIRKIVLEVINQLNNKCIDSIFVLSNNNNFCFQNEIENMGYKLCISNTADNINCEDYCMIIINDLSIEILSCISNLLYKNDNISFIINALLSGKKVIALKNTDKFDTYKRTASNPLFSKLLEFENTAKSYGLSIVETKDFLSSFCKKNDSEVINKSDCFDFTSKKIITKCDIIDIVNNYSSIKVNRNVIITPLVMDYIKDNKINILYE